MWLSDIIEILEILKNGNGDFCVQRIENNVIYFANDKKIYFKDIKEVANLVEFKKRFKEKLREGDDFS